MSLGPDDSGVNNGRVEVRVSRRGRASIKENSVMEEGFVSRNSEKRAFYSAACCGLIEKDERLEWVV